MNCERVRLLIDAYTTDELDLAAALDVDEHLSQCSGCTGELESLRALRGTLSEPSLRHRAPQELRRRVSAALGARDGEVVRHPQVDFRATRGWRLALAAAVAALMLLPWVVVYRIASRGDVETLTADATASHVRSMMGDHLLDVPSTDQHTVKPWFNGKLDFSPTVVDLAKDGFPLVGGRLDYLGNHPVAALVYRRNQHVINVYTWPSQHGSQEPSIAERNGYHVLSWASGGMNWVAVSDVNAPELRQFVDKLSAEAGVAGGIAPKSR